MLVVKINFTLFRGFFLTFHVQLDIINYIVPEICLFVCGAIFKKRQFLGGLSYAFFFLGFIA